MLSTVLTFLGLSAVTLAMLPTTPPVTPRHPVTDHYHTIKVVDEYQWLEDGHSDDVRRWSQAQNAYAREYLERLPNTEAIRARVKAVLADRSASYGRVMPAGGRFFTMKREPPKQQPFLIELNRLHDPDSMRVLVEPEEYRSRGDDKNRLVRTFTRW